MKKTKRFVTMLICIAIIFAFLSPVAVANDDTAVNDTTDNPNGDGGPSLEDRINILEAQLAALFAQLGEMGEVDSVAIDRQIREAAEVERFMFRLEYINVCFMIANNDLLNRQCALTERQLELERVRLTLGFSTQRNVDALHTHLGILERQIELNNEIIEIKRRYVNTRRGASGYGFIGDFSIPAPAVPTVRTADELRSALIANNTSLFVLDRQINQLRRNNGAWSEIRLLESQRDLLVRQLEMAAIRGWTAYLEAKAQYDLAETARPTLTARLALLDDLHRLGEIGAVARLEQRYAVYEKLHGADTAAIALAVAVAEVDFMARGIAG